MTIDHLAASRSSCIVHQCCHYNDSTKHLLSQIIGRSICAWALTWHLESWSSSQLLLAIHQAHGAENMGYTTCLVGGFNPSQSCHLNQTIPLVWLNMVEKQSPAIKSGSKIPKSSWFSYDFPHHFHCFFDDFPIFWTTITGDFPFPPLAALADPKKKRQLRLPWRWSLPHGCRRGNRLERQNWSTGPKDRGNVRISLEKYGTNMEKCGHMINDLEKNENLIGKNAKWWWTMEQYGTIMDQLMEKWLTKQW